MLLACRAAVVIAFVALSAACGKADISARCDLDQSGRGVCVFTNTGDASGAVSGNVPVVTVTRPVTTRPTPKFCSGEIAAKTTTRVPFEIKDPRTVCLDFNDDDGKPVPDVSVTCKWGFEADGGDPF